MKLAGKKRVCTALAIIWLSASAVASKTEKPGIDLSPEDLKVLEEGKLVTKVDEYKDDKGNVNHRMGNYLIIDVPPKEVWKVLTEPEKDHEWISGVKKSEVLKRDDDSCDVHYEVSIIFMDFQFNIHRRFQDQDLYIKNDLIEEMENDLEVADSYYALYPHANGEKTIMKYSLRLVVSEGIPKSVEDWFVKQSGKGWMQNLKKRAESKGTWKK